MIGNFARNLYREGNVTGAKYLFTANTNLNPESAEAHYLLADYSYQVADLHTAKKHVDEAIKLSEEVNESSSRLEKLKDKIAQNMQSQQTFN